MTRPALAFLLLAAIPACSPSAPAQTPDPVKEAPSAPPAEGGAAAPSAEPTSAPEAPRPAATESTSPSETLARDLLKSGGRRIGYSAAKKRFVVPIDIRRDGGRGLDVRFYDDEGQQRDNQRVCQPGECEDKLNEIAKDLIPKLAARFEQEGYESIFAIGWPAGRDELDVSSMELKLRYDKGRLSKVVDKKPLTSLRIGGGKPPKAASPSAIYPVPAAKLIGMFAAGDSDVPEFFVFKLP